jgi:hypothetical protein
MARIAAEGIVRHLEGINSLMRWRGNLEKPRAMGALLP